MAKRTRRKPQGHPAKVAAAAAAQHTKPAAADPLDLLVRHAVASGDPQGIEAACGLRDELSGPRDDGHIRIVLRGDQLSIVPLTEVGRAILPG